MANLSNLNNKFLVTTGGNVLIGQTGAIGSSILQVSGEALFGNGTNGLLLSYSNGNSSGIIDTGHSSTALEFRVGNTQELLINGSSATFAGAIYLLNTSARISAGGSGEVGFNYNTSATGSLVWYGGTTSSKFSVTNAGNITLAGGQILTTAGVDLALNPNTGVVSVAGNLTATTAGTTTINSVSTGNWAGMMIKSSDADGAYLFFNDTSGERARIYSSANNDLNFSTNGGGSLALTLASSTDATFAGRVESQGFSSTVGTTNYSLLTRNSANTAVYIQQAGTGNIVDFRYGSQAAGQGTSAMSISSVGTTTFDSGATATTLVLNSNASYGAYTTWKNNGTIKGELGYNASSMYFGAAASTNTILMAGNGNKYKITSGGSHQFSNDGSFATSHTYTFRDAVGINNPNSLSAPSVAGFTMSVGRSSSGNYQGAIYSAGTTKTASLNVFEYVGAASGETGIGATTTGGDLIITQGGVHMAQASNTVDYGGGIYYGENYNNGSCTMPIGTLNPGGSANQYLWIKFNLTTNAMFWLQFKGYDYNCATVIDSLCGGYVYSGSYPNVHQAAISNPLGTASCQTYIQTMQISVSDSKVCVCLNTNTSGTSNRWGSVTVFGGMDTITGNYQIKIEGHQYTASTTNPFS